MSIGMKTFAIKLLKMEFLANVKWRKEPALFWHIALES